MNIICVQLNLHVHQSILSIQKHTVKIFTENLNANIKLTMPSRIDAESCNKNTIWFKYRTCISQSL